MLLIMSLLLLIQFFYKTVSTGDISHSGVYIVK